MAEGTFKNCFCIFSSCFVKLKPTLVGNDVNAQGAKTGNIFHSTCISEHFCIAKHGIHIFQWKHEMC